MIARIDSDVVADDLVAQTEVVELLTRLRQTGLAISTITFMGPRKESPQPKSSTDRTSHAAFHAGTPMIVVSRPIAARAAAIRLDLRSRRRPVAGRVLDLIVAATAIEHNLTLVTRNVRDDQEVGHLHLLR